MRSSHLLLVFVASAVAFSPGKRNIALTQDRADSPPPVSPCVEKCLESAAAHSPCGTATNIQCACTNPAFQSAAGMCIESNCPSEDLLEALKLQQQQCSPTTQRTATSSGTSSTHKSTSSSTTAHSHDSKSVKPTTTTKSQPKPTSTHANGKPVSSSHHVSPSAKTSQVSAPIRTFTSTVPASLPIVSIAASTEWAAYSSADAYGSSESVSVSESSSASADPSPSLASPSGALVVPCRLGVAALLAVGTAVFLW
ncbi:hypothetical protein C8F01DRAFT_1378119 [Mycena amicta]|nr:hypothetical protein C8F01DRAFT_1378119 [Mycena amicta]